LCAKARDVFTLKHEVVDNHAGPLNLDIRTGQGLGHVETGAEGLVGGSYALEARVRHAPAPSRPTTDDATGWY